MWMIPYEERASCESNWAKKYIHMQHCTQDFIKQTLYLNTLKENRNNWQYTIKSNSENLRLLSNSFFDS